MKNNNASPEDVVLTSSHGKWLFSRLPLWVIDTLTNEQKEAIYMAADDPTWSQPPINIRLNIPFFKRHYFLTIVGGEGKRSQERRVQEKHTYPLRTAANIFFFAALGAVFYGSVSGRIG